MKKISRWLKLNFLKLLSKIQNTFREHPFSVVFTILIVVLGVYFMNFSKGISSDNADWGTFGDFINGATAPIIGIIGVVLTYTILNNQNKESSQAEFKFMFEMMFNSSETQIEKITFKKGKTTYTGRKAIEYLNGHIKGLIDFNIKTGVNGIDDAVRAAFTSALSDADDSFTPYMKNIHNCLKIIDLYCNDQHKKTYANLLRAHLSKSEMIFLLYNGVGKTEFSEFKRRIENYTMLQDIYTDTRVIQDVKNLYNSKAFLDN